MKNTKKVMAAFRFFPETLRRIDALTRWLAEDQNFQRGLFPFTPKAFTRTSVLEFLVRRSYDEISIPRAKATSEKEGKEKPVRIQLSKSIRTKETKGKKNGNRKK